MECELKLSKQCTGVSSQYSGLADKNCCEPCQQLYMKQYWAKRRPVQGKVK